MGERLKKSPFGTDVRELPVVRRALNLVRRRERRREKSTKGTMENFNAYREMYRKFKIELEGGGEVTEFQHRKLMESFHRLSPGQQEELKGRSPGCLYTREDHGPDGLILFSSSRKKSGLCFALILFR